MTITRRRALQLLASTASVAAVPFPLAGLAIANDAQWRHGLSLFGELKYGPGFSHFDYVKPDAPKGGRARLAGIGTFDSLNPFTFKGNPTGLVGYTVDSLLVRSLDEPSAEYGLIAEAMRHPEDFSWVEFRIHPDARFHDGEPIKPEDAIWSMEALKEAHPQYAFYYKNVVKGEKVDGRTVRFTFSEAGNRELPHITGQLPVLAKHWWTAADAEGNARDINSTTLEPPLGNGAYRVSQVNVGDSVTVERVEDYWARDLPVNVGADNFEEISLVYFRDQAIAVEAFKGDQYDWRNENNSKVWATGYDFPAVERGDVLKETFELKNGQGMQGFVFNTRLDKFADPRVRQAFNYAFDFEWANKNLFYGQYERTPSYFSNSELAATGLPGEAELAILEPLKGQIPPEVFTEEYRSPVNLSQQDRRDNLRKAAQLLKEAGWTIGPDRVMRNADGNAMDVEFLLVQPAFERIVLPYAKQLERLGIRTTVRTVDVPQYRRRTDSFDFDVVVSSWPQSLSPGNEQRDFWGSLAAERPASRNLAGIKDPAIDKLIDRIIFATSRDDLVTATRALDRVLLWNHFVVPMWYIPYERTVRWNRFGKPGRIPEYSVGFPRIWWWSEERAASIKGGQ